MTIKITTEITWYVVGVSADHIDGIVGCEVAVNSDAGTVRVGKGTTLNVACENLANTLGDPTLTGTIYAEAKQLLEREQDA